MTLCGVYFVTATKKISEAEEILQKMRNASGKELEDNFRVFASTIPEIFSHLLDEYNKKFGLKIEKMGLEKFKSRAKKAGKLDAIRFIIWYEKEYRKIRDDEICGVFLERERDLEFSNLQDGLNSCSEVLNKAREISYYAYENF